MIRRSLIATLASLALFACATDESVRRFDTSVQGDGLALGQIGRLYILHAEADQYDPLRRQSAELANVIERQLLEQGYATARGTRRDVDLDSLGTLRQEFDRSASTHVMTINVYRATVLNGSRILRYFVDVAVFAPGRATGVWRYRAKLDSGPGQHPIDLARDLIREMQVTGLSRAVVSL